MKSPLDLFSWDTIIESGWWKYAIGALIGLCTSIVSSFAPDAFWVHDNRQALSTLMINQPLIQRDISDLKEGMGELNITIKELTIELQKRSGTQRFVLEKPRK